EPSTKPPWTSTTAFTGESAAPAIIISFLCLLLLTTVVGMTAFVGSPNLHWSSRSNDSFRDGEHDAKSGFAAYHALVSLSDPIQWEHFIHGMHAGKHTEFQRLLGIHCRAGIPASHRSSSHDQWQHAQTKWFCRCGRNQEFAVHRQSIHERGNRLCVRRRRQNHARAAQLLQFRRCLISARINVMMRSQLPCQRFLVPPSPKSHRHESHLPRVLNSQVSQSANAVHGHDVASPRARMAQRVEYGDARAHERPGFLRRQFIRNRRQRRRRRDHMLGIPAVEIDARDLAIGAHCEIAAPALFALEAMSTVPPDTDAPTLFPASDAAADRIDPPGDFMARHTGILNPGPETFFDEHVAVANAARLHLHANLSRARLRDVAFYQFPISAWFADLRRLHCIHNSFAGLAVALLRT